jgi:hypothetical protein
MPDVRDAAFQEPVPARIRTMLLWTLVFGVAGMLAELLLIGHDESASQWMPLVLLAATLAAGVWSGLAPGRLALRSLQLLLVLMIASGVVGVGLHFQGNREFELEMYPSLSGFELITETLTGATPVLAPGSMSVLGVVGLAFTYRHPLLRQPRAAANPEEVQS